MGVIVVDTGVFIGVLNAADPHHEASRHALQAMLDQGHVIVVPASVYAELLVEPFQRDSWAVDQVDSFLENLPARIEPISRSVAKAAARLRALHGRGLRLPDALVVATAEVIGASSLVTTDGRWPARLPVQVVIVGGDTA